MPNQLMTDCHNESDGILGEETLFVRRRNRPVWAGNSTPFHFTHRPFLCHCILCSTQPSNSREFAALVCRFSLHLQLCLVGHSLQRALDKKVQLIFRPFQAAMPSGTMAPLESGAAEKIEANTVESIPSTMKAAGASTHIPERPMPTSKPQRPGMPRFTTSKENVLSTFFIGAIDQGTTSSRFIIFDGTGQPVTSHQHE